jgi:hypothetical protein
MNPKDTAPVMSGVPTATSLLPRRSSLAAGRRQLASSADAEMQVKQTVIDGGMHGASSFDRS